MYRKMNSNEKEWISKILDAEFKGKEILSIQVSKAIVSYEQDYTFLSLKFKLEGKVDKYPYKVRVPVEMRAFQEQSAPIVFLLHVIDGVVNELEVISADSSKLEVDKIKLEKLEYEVDKDVQIGD